MHHMQITDQVNSISIKNKSLSTLSEHFLFFDWNFCFRSSWKVVWNAIYAKATCCCSIENKRTILWLFFSSIFCVSSNDFSIKETKWSKKKQTKTKVFWLIFHFSRLSCSLAREAVAVQLRYLNLNFDANEICAWNWSSFINIFIK